MELDLLIFALSGVKSDRRDERMRCRDERVGGVCGKEKRERSGRRRGRVSMVYQTRIGLGVVRCELLKENLCFSHVDFS